MKRAVYARGIFSGICVFALLASLRAAAVDTLHLEMAAVEGPGWKAAGVTLDLNWLSPTEVALTVSAVQLQLPPPLENLSNATLICSNTVIDAAAVRCHGGLLRLQSPTLDRPEISVDLTYYPVSGAADIALKDVRLAGGALNLIGTLTQAGWQFTVAAKVLEIAKLPAALKGFMNWPSGIKATGRLGINARVSGQDKKIAQLQVKGTVTALKFSDGGGRKASEKLAADFTLDAKPVADGWQFAGHLSAKAGQLYLEPIFWEFPRKAVKFSARGVWHTKQNTLNVAQLSIDHPGIAQAQATLVAALNPWQVRSATLKIPAAPFAPLYKVYLQPLLIGTAFDALDGTGRIGIDLAYRDQSIDSVIVDTKAVGLEDKRGRYGLSGLNGTLAWTRGATPLRSDLGWGGGHVYKLTLGASRVKLQSAQSNLDLREAMSLPVLDGALQIKTLNLQKVATPDMNLQLTGALTPVSMEAFSKAMDWPLMSGKFSSVIPNLSYTKNTINVGGDLRIRVFEGDVTVRKLRLEDPFGVLPLLSADIDIDKLDLEALTRTFSFGKIQGKLSGAVSDLRMANWQPVAFQARLATPADDTSRHRISQKAVNSLSSLGGASGVLSRSLLRFFEEFSYARLGLSCRLSKGVCEMGGVEPAENGYYIVKGGGIPRIDVRGFATEVDWDVLVERLKNATRSEGPVVQ
ncbi:MAG: hypothetical protein ABIT92_01395 [Gammaproteobacteria bacterium]